MNFFDRLLGKEYENEGGVVSENKDVFENIKKDDEK